MKKRAKKSKHRFNGVPFEFYWTHTGGDFTWDHDGICGTLLPEGAKKERFCLAVRENLEGIKRLTVLIHEALHAIHGPKYPEEKIRQISKDLGRFLWRQGYRTKEK
jgi:hypothetical protein